MDTEEKQPENNGGKMEGGITGKGFRKGQSGNPAGHKKGVPNLVSRYRKLCDSIARLPVPPIIADSKRGIALRQLAGRAEGRFKNEEGIAAATIYAALQGESWAIQQLAGRPDQNLDIRSNGETLGSSIDVDSLTPEQVEKITDAIIAIRKPVG